MLTPQEIKEAVFEKTIFNGYDFASVDDFLEKIAADYGALYKENAILKGKIKVLVEKVEEYRSTEDAMRMALLTAQKMGEDIMTEANKKRAEALDRTDSEIKKRLTEMRNKVADEEARLKAAARETARFVEVSQEIIRRHAEFLSKLDMIRRAAVPPPQEPSREEQIADTAVQIDSAVEKITSDRSQPEKAVQNPKPETPKSEEPKAEAAKEYDDESEPTRPYVIATGTDGEEVTPRPKFDFDNLQFGINFSNDDK